MLAHSPFRSVFGPPTECWSMGEDNQSADASPEILAVERDLRLLLTSRPGGGGSPTKRCTLGTGRVWKIGA